MALDTILQMNEGFETVDHWRANHQEAARALRSFGQLTAYIHNDGASHVFLLGCLHSVTDGGQRFLGKRAEHLLESPIGEQEDVTT